MTTVFGRMRAAPRRGILAQTVFAAALALLAGLPPAAADARETLKVAYLPVAPVAMRAEGQDQATGIAVDFFKRHIAPHLDYDIVFLELPIGRALQDLDAGAVDSMLFLIRNPERDAKYSFADRPFGKDQSGIVVRTDSPLKQVERWDQLRGLKVVAAKGGFRSPAFEASGVDITENSLGANWIELMMRQVVAGRFDAAYLPTISSLRHEAKIKGMTGDLRFLPLPEPPVSLIAAFRKTIPAKLLADYNAALAQAPADAYDVIAESYLK